MNFVLGLDAYICLLRRPCECFGNSTAIIATGKNAAIAFGFEADPCRPKPLQYILGLKAAE
jgi:hypothetical protein